MALALLTRAVARGDDDQTTRVNRALALEHLGRATAAATAWDDVAAHSTDATLVARARARASTLQRAP
jgi:hypothetical protein